MKGTIARHEIAWLEAQQRADRHREAVVAANGGDGGVNGVNGVMNNGSGNQQNNRAVFEDNRRRLDKVWRLQEEHRLKLDAKDAVIAGGTKYERKKSGPFQGKLVSQGKLITIDGEDYV